MTRHVLLDNVSHKDLRILPGYAHHLGFGVGLARVFPAEFVQLQMEYPLVFMRNRESGHFEPVAIFGLTENENLYLTDSGWDARYIPLSIQRQPFLIGFRETTEGGLPQRTPVVHVDMEHPKVSLTEGEPVFLEHGGESPLLERMSSVLMAIHEGGEANLRFSRLLAGLDLVESSTMEFILDSGEKFNLSGLYVINEDRLRTLNGAALEVLHQAGHLQDIYMMLASMPNFRRLVDRKNRALRSAAR